MGLPNPFIAVRTGAGSTASVIGLDAKASVRAATTGVLAGSPTYSNGVLTRGSAGALAAQDGITLVANERLLVKNQASALQNGIYVVTTVGDGSTAYVLTRSTDMDEWSEVPSAFTLVEEGTTLADTAWVCTSDTGGTLGSTAISWSRFTADPNTVTAAAVLTSGQIPMGDGARGLADSTVVTLGSGPATLSSPTSASLQFGAADVDTNASMVAQTLRTQGALTGGTTNQAGKNFTVIVSPGKGTGAGGSLIVQTAPAGSSGTTVGTPTTALTIDSTQLVTVASAFNLTTGGPTSLAHALTNGNNDWRFYVNSGLVLQAAGGPSVLVGGLTGVRNSGDLLTVGYSQTGNNADTSQTIWNQSTGAAASTSFYLGNSASNTKFSITLNSTGNSGGNGANTVTMNSTNGLYMQAAGTNAISATSAGNIVLGNAAIATNATDGFLYAVSGTGTPTGVPTTFTGRVPIYIDTTNSQMWLYLGGAWKQPKTPAAAALVTWQ